MDTNIKEKPLLDLFSQTQVKKPTKTSKQKAIRKTFKGTRNLANLLPTGSIFIFQMLSPVFSHQGKCQSILNQILTLVLLSFCSLSCYLLSFTDSFRDRRGKVRYGVATFRGLWVIEGSDPPEGAEEYRIGFVDFFHGFSTVMVFGVVAVFDQNVVNCFDLLKSKEAKEVMAIMRVVVSLVCCIMFLAFPTKRHGIGFPLSRT